MTKERTRYRPPITHLIFIALILIFFFLAASLYQPVTAQLNAAYLPGAALPETSLDTASDVVNQATSYDFSLTFKDNKFQLEATNFPPKTVYYVKLTTANDPNGKWRKVGVLHINAEGQGKLSDRLPSALRAGGSLDMCLKNIDTDDLVCQTVHK